VNPATIISSHRPTDRRRAATHRNARVPEHVAIIMDGNGRWARSAACRAPPGIGPAPRACAPWSRRACASGVKVLTLFAFSSENWRRPPSEVNVLMELFMSTLQVEVQRLVEHEVQLRIIGDLSAFSPRLQRSSATRSKRPATTAR
jgi:undecaprenyl diphosphate synthase